MSDSNFSASAVLASKKENSCAAHSPAGEQLLSVAELRAAIFSHLDARTLFAFRAFCPDWYVSVVSDPHSREALLLSPLEEEPCTEDDLDKQLFRSRNTENDVAFLSTSLPRSQFSSTPFIPSYSGAAIKLLNIGLSAGSGDLQFARTILSNHQTAVTVPLSCIDGIKQGDIGYKMLVVSPPVSSVRFEIDGLYQHLSMPQGIPNFFSQSQLGVSMFGPYKEWGSATEIFGVTMGDLQAAISSCISARSSMSAATDAQVKLMFDNVVLLKPEDMLSVQKQREENAEEDRELEKGSDSDDDENEEEKGSGVEEDSEA